MHQLFLDANTYLGFYSLSSADIAMLGKVVELVKLEKIQLLLPIQIIDEVRRNRARVISERLKPLKEARIQAAIPLMVDNIAEADSLRTAVREANRAHAKLVQELITASQQGTLPADKLIAELFSSTKPLIAPLAIQAAQQRKALGNPPGKGSSIGDGVNWETLLLHAQEMEDLHLVSADGDFASALDPSTFDEYLANEWARLKRSDVEYYRDIKAFLDKAFPQIRLASDVRKYFLIDSLVGSTNFANTHDVVGQLAQYDSFSADEASRLLSGGLENTQVRWLARDEDVQTLIRKVMGPHRAALPKQLVDRWEYLLAGRGYTYGPIPSDTDLSAPEPDPDAEALF